MSTQKGNVNRTRPQKHANITAFKNNLHDTSHTIKKINNIEIANVCPRCKEVLGWKIKYKKYKPLKAPSTCVKCHQKSVKHAYHTMCAECACAENVCPKCGKPGALIPPSQAPFDSSILKTAEICDQIKALPERRRRTFHRFVEKIAGGNDGRGIKECILEKLKDLSVGDADGDSSDDCND